MEIPSHLPVFENSSSIYWQDENGIICSVSKKEPKGLNQEQRMSETQEFIDRFGGHKHCILIDAQHAQPSSIEERKEGAETLKKLTKAMAVIIYNAVGRMLTNLFIGIQKPPYPLKLFKPGEEDKAIEWLKQHL